MKANDLNAYVDTAVKKETRRYPQTYVESCVMTTMQDVVDTLADAAAVLEKDRRGRAKQLAERIGGVLNRLNAVSDSSNDASSFSFDESDKMRR